MKIRLIEPLGISETKLKEYKDILSIKGHDFKYYLNHPKDENEQIERMDNCDIVMIANSPLSKKAINSNKNLKYINVSFTGFDHVDLESSKENNILISNASGYSDTSVKELVLGMVLNIYRQINQGDQATRHGYTHKHYYNGTELKDKTVGIIGTGSIGADVCKLFLAFDTKVIAYSRTKKEELINLGVEYRELDEVLRESDIVSIHLPLNKLTTGMISKEKLSLMKKSAVFINCARGNIVDNSALAVLLNDGKLAYAGIDVFEMEPPIPSDHPLLNAKNVLVQPHIAYLTKESMIRRAQIAFDNLINYLEGTPKNIVN